MPGFDFPVRTKLAIWAALGVLLVAGMLAVQQIGDRSAARERAIAGGQQLAAVEALRGARDLENMRIESREICLGIAASEVEHAADRLPPAAASAAKHIGAALSLSNDPADKDALETLDQLTRDYV